MVARPGTQSDRGEAPKTVGGAPKEMMRDTRTGTNQRFRSYLEKVQTQVARPALLSFSAGNWSRHCRTFSRSSATEEKVSFAPA